MIKPGQRFTARDLHNSVAEVCERDIKKFITPENSTGVVVGDTIMFPAEMTPHQYAYACTCENRIAQSSARDLDAQLRNRGVQTTRRFSYDYKTGGIPNDKIIKDAYCLEWFKQIHVYANTNFKNAKDLDEYVDIVHDAFRLTYYYAQYLWAANPQACRKIADALQYPLDGQWGQITGATLGIGYQFHPDDVYEFAIKHIAPDLTREQREKRYAEQLAFKNEMMDQYGLDTGCLVLSPQSREKLTKIVTHTDTPYKRQLLEQFWQKITGRVR